MDKDGIGRKRDSSEADGDMIGGQEVELQGP